MEWSTRTFTCIYRCWRDEPCLPFPTCLCCKARAEGRERRAKELEERAAAAERDAAARLNELAAAVQVCG